MIGFTGYSGGGEVTDTDRWYGYLRKRRYTAYTYNTELINAKQLSDYFNSEECCKDLESIKTSFNVKVSENMGRVIGGIIGLGVGSINPLLGAASGGVITSFLAESLRDGKISFETRLFLINLCERFFKSSKSYLTVASSNSKEEALQIASKKCRQLGMGFYCKSVIAPRENVTIHGSYYSLASLLSELGSPFHDYNNFFELFFEIEKPVYDHLNIPSVMIRGFPEYINIYDDSVILNKNIYISNDYSDQDKKIIKKIFSEISDQFQIKVV